MRTILLLLKLRDLPGFLLPRLFCETGSASAGSSISGDMRPKPLSQSHETSSWHFFDKAWVTYKPLWTPIREGSRGTLSTSKRKSSTGQPTWSTYKRSSKSLIPINSKRRDHNPMLPGRPEAFCLCPTGCPSP